MQSGGRSAADVSAAAVAVNAASDGRIVVDFGYVA